MKIDFNKRERIAYPNYGHIFPSALPFIYMLVPLF